MRSMLICVYAPVCAYVGESEGEGANIVNMHQHQS